MLKSRPVQMILVVIAICSMLLLSMSFINPCCFIPDGTTTTTSTPD